MRVLVRRIVIWTGLAIVSASALAEPASDRDHRGNPRRFPLTTSTSENVPPRVPLVVIRSPNWQDFRIYPRAALRYDQQGIVGVELLIDANGVPSGCRIALSSGYVELDDGTCDLWLMVRFQPPLNAAGETVETVHHFRTAWMIASRRRLEPARMVATMALVEGVPTSCRLERSGDLTRNWDSDGCGVTRGLLHDYLAAKPSLSSRATIAVDLVPAGSAQLPSADPPGRLAVARRTFFSIGPDGEPTECRVDPAADSARIAHLFGGPCGPFLSGSWFRLGRGRSEVRSGMLEIRIYLESGGSVSSADTPNEPLASSDMIGSERQALPND
jgi:TonB family protein